MNRKPLTRLQEAEGACYRLHQTFWQGDNRFGSYGRNVQEAFERHAQVIFELTGKRPHIYDNAPGR